jgi:type I restriction enzyme S subunit
LEILVPPRKEQDQIVRYLDWQVSKINKLIAAKKKQIRLLKELRKAITDEGILHGFYFFRDKR